MSSKNLVILLGRLTRDPEMRYTPSGKAVTSFSIATDRYVPEGSDGPKADFHNCVAFNMGNRKLAEHAAEYLRKCSLTYVEGRLQTRKWTTQDGQDRWSTEVIITDIQFCQPKQDRQQQQAQAPEQGQQGREAWQDVDPDDIPF